MFFFTLKSLACDSLQSHRKKKPRVPNLSGFIESNYMYTYIYTEYMHMRQYKDNRHPARQNP